MNIKSTLWILLFIFIQKGSLQEDYEYDYKDQPQNCSVTESIKGGHVTYSQDGLQGSILTYHCGLAQYPHPVSYRTCEADGEWSPMRLPSGRLVSRPTCKDVLCPGQLQLDNGDFWPRNQWFRVGTSQSFSCQEGFTLYGSEQRNCTLSGHWTGATPVCADHADDCDDPGIPPGAERSASRFQTGEKVTYRCQTGLHLLGSSERVCLENREWSGSAPRCQGPNTFDSPDFVAGAMAESLAGMMDVLSPDFKKKNVVPSFGRSFLVGEVSRMHIYILLDTSGSIKEKDFNKSRNATIALIKKLDSYEVQLNFHVLSFASETKVIVDITNTDVSGNADEVIEALNNFVYSSHGRKTGTNLSSALHNVQGTMNFLRVNSTTKHLEGTQNIIIIETDGYSNRGAKPQIALAHIRSSLGYTNNTSNDHSNEKMLDVYVFGVGSKVNKEELNSLASKKRYEKHFFVLETYEKLGDVFNQIISDSSVTMCGVAQEEISKDLEHSQIKSYTRPWHVTLSSECSGSIVSPNWVLTAAHCFARNSKGRGPKQLTIHYGGEHVEFNYIVLHPKYDVYALKHRNVSEFYDYDVALVRTIRSIPLTQKARPICLPCTIAASRAMKKINSTCEEHRKTLLDHAETPAYFIRRTERKQTHIHTNGQRASCVDKAKWLLKEPTNVTLDEFIPDRFLCTGSTAKYHGAIACKGQSGGSLFLQKRMRYFQVGVVSWGTIDMCDNIKDANPEHSIDRPPPEARDFYIDLFKILPWLKKHLGEEIKFLPEIK
ncbi:complement C2 [Austrofundulus limnaeus]|uniref:C3/C5 convertase n=1 Tax=Austrofundulus limnaeus TaxID=52670 RepID=A0A2I4CN99_AUSLI|nr:PREDICTED: complement C2-like [Austrofundulus limnaeus]